jgi:hypothetical protein
MILRNIFPKAFLFFAIGFLAGCGSNSVPPQVGEITVGPSTTIMVGDKASLTLPVSGTDIKFEWTVRRGSLIDPTQQNVIYIAPDSPGPDIVTVKVAYGGGEIIKSIPFNVGELPPPTTTPVLEDTPTTTAVPKPITCNHPSVTKNLFPQLADESGQFPIYGPETETRFLCQAVYDRVHDDGQMSVHIKFESFQENFGWWGIATPNGYNAALFSEICLWAYVQEPNQSFRLKMKDTAKKEKGIIIILEITNEWEEVCVELTKFVELGVKVTSLDNVNLGFETPTGGAEIWIADLEFKQ